MDNLENLIFILYALQKLYLKNITINDSTEIAEARWIDPDDFLKSDDANNYNNSVVAAAINNKKLKLTEQQKKLRVSDGEVFFLKGFIYL